MFSCEIWEYLTQFKKIALAISGGKDSMTLLDIFASNEKWKNKYIVINIQHNLRGQTSIDDSAFVCDFCKERDIEFYQFDIDVVALCAEMHYTIEQGARIMRREIFASFVEQGKVDRVLTAHHKDDQIESILMHILRGSGLNGLIGMPLDDGKLVRPMLNITREKIDAYAQEKGLVWRQDDSNFDNNFTRNKMRNEILPMLEEVYPSCGNNIARLGKIAAKAVDFIELSLPQIEEKNGEYSIPLTVFDKSYIAEQTIVKCIDLLSSRVDLTFQQIDSVLKLVQKENGSRVDLSRGLSAYKQPDSIAIAFREKRKEYCYEFGVGEFDCGDWQVDVSTKDNGGLRVDADKLWGCKIRNRAIGDRIKKFGGESKSLGDFLTDKKIPKRLRENLPIIAKENIVFVACAIDISQMAKIDETTKRTYYINAFHTEKKWKE